jgi:putative ABC transport system ATP-binding protein
MLKNNQKKQENQGVDIKTVTCLMITHNLKDALLYGNRLILLHQGEVQLDIRASEKSKLKLHELMRFFNQLEEAV